MEQSIENVSLDLQSLSLKPKDVLNIIFVGHVDSGKSTICGRILVDLDLVDERTLKKYVQQSELENRASWYLSWCMDLNPEEREKGITTEVGTASFDLPHTRINVLDAPGHKQFVSEMIDAVSRADVGILIVSARSGEFEAGFKGGQTKEHLLLLKSGNVENVIVLINKMDECNWDKERFEEISAKIMKFSKNLFKDIMIIPVSGYNGDNIKNRKNVSFYNGLSFLEYLDTIKTSKKAELGPSMLVLEKVKTSGNVIFYVKVDSGKFTTKTDYKILPLNKEDKILSIMNEDDVEVGETQPGETYKMKFKDFSDEVFAGSRVVPKNGSEYSVCTEFFAQLVICDVKNALTVGYSCIMHINLMQISCKITEMFSMEKKRIKIARKGDRVVGLLKLENPIVVTSNKDRKERFALRDEGLTIAAGLIKKIVK